MIGFEEELAKTVGNEIAAIVADLSRYWPLTNLVGVTVSYDYATALAGIDRGFGKSLPPPQATNDEELGQGSAMAVSVIHDGIWKTHVVFGPYVVNMLSSENDGENITGTKLVAHELAHAVDHENKRRAFGEICLQSVIELIPDPKEQYLWEKSHFIWDEYFASRLSVAFDPDGEPYEDELFATAYIACRNRLREARRKYHWHEISLEEFLEILGHNLRMVILSAGYLFGLCDGLNKDFSEVAPQSAPLLQEPLGLSIMRFHSVLLALWENRGEWTSYNEFLAMNAPAEALLNDLDLFVHTTDDGMVYMDIPARLEHVGLN
ncbi:MAG: hypothetical protein KC643_27930 [Nitrospira sp.]|nr:hypothetical protein [Nitrospira sp.]